MNRTAAALAIALMLAAPAVAAEEGDTVAAYNARMVEVGVKTRAAVDECEAKRKSGELTSEAAVVECANPQLLAAYIDARVLYLDLTKLWLAVKLDAAKRLDKGEITAEQRDLELAEWRLKIATEEERRKKAAAETAAGRDPPPHTPECHILAGEKHCF